ncbi:MAG: response regulator transcription factor [Lachnospiraceae bacterium]|nr:response regulator transcription factor [Lachnospiraceae bacterium]
MNEIKVIIADESRIIREWLRDKLASDDSISIVKALGDLSEVKDACKDEEADVLLINAYMRYGLSSIGLAGEIKNETKIRVIIMSDYPIYPMSRSYIDTENMFFWNRNKDTREISKIIKEVYNESRYGELTDDESKKLKKYDIRYNTVVGNCLSSEFTDMDIAVIEQLSNGCSYADIAKRLDLKINTVKYLISSMLKKTGYKNAITLVASAVVKKLIVPENSDEYRK